MIRVLHYGMSPNLGGIETYLLNLAKTIDSSHYQFDFLFSDYGEKPIYAPELPDNTFHGVTPRRVSLRRNRQELEALFEGGSFDILHFHANTTSYVEPVRAALRHGVRVVFHSHSAGASGSQLTRILHRWNRARLPWDQTRRVAVSGDAGRWMFGASSFQIIHNGIDVDAFAFDGQIRTLTRQALGISDTEHVIGHVGAFLPAKNHRFLVDRFAEVLDRRSDSLLLLVGSGPLESDVRQQVEALRISDRVRFLGRREDVAALMCAMDTFAFPSLHEGLPLATLEAQASGLRCTMSDSITDEVVVTDACVQLSLAPLATPHKAWVDRLLMGSAGDRLTGATTIRRAGLTIGSNTTNVTSIYESMLPG